MDQETLNLKVSNLKAGQRIRYEGLSDKVYHAAFDTVSKMKCVGSTDIVKFIQAPKKFKYALDNRDNKFNKNFLIGSMTHCLVLEELEFSNRYVVADDTIKTRASKAYKALEEANIGKEVCLLPEYIQAREIAHSALEDHANYFTEGVSEVSYFTRDRETGLVLKARIDYEKGDLSIDLKTTKNASERGFKRAIDDLYYYIQATHYLEVSGLTDFVFIPVEKEAPYLAGGKHFIKPEYIDFGLRERREALNKLAECSRNNKWPGYNTGLIMCDLPLWKATKYQELAEA